MKDSNGGIWALCFAIAMGAAAWLFSDHVPFQREVTVYLGWCPNTRTAGECAGGEEAGGITTYKAVEETQSVVYWSEDGAPSGMTKCAVRDASNWSCPLSETYVVSMAAGKTNDHPVFGMPYYQVSKARWWWLWLHTKHS
jgi:hypothetical protein